MDPKIVRVIPHADGSARVDLVPGLLNSRGTLHGGVLMALAQLAQEHSCRVASLQVRPLRLNVTYLRPASGGGSLEFRSAFVRRGRRLWTLRTEIVRPDGVTAAIATGTGTMSAAAAGA
ncbi:PaaI family thioesterase [Nocardia sp. CA2R105]|uniref:PaaI family thioesterase n=1 Tax=Nocardia coffeae TaxID=2873381 RepID=UPI001CA65E3F|nr:PaaI family thioesterase [Nocardia coffeae]MBY8862891.1 PaaI family thioesterase [Nocardia coffeae]